MNYSGMKLPELKSEAKARSIKGFSSMKKADLITALEASDKPKSLGNFTRPESMIDAIKAALTNAREQRSNRGRKAGAGSVTVSKKSATAKAESFALQRGSESAKLTAPQARRVRKTERAFC